jgi:hypothetical protein
MSKPYRPYKPIPPAPILPTRASPPSPWLDWRPTGIGLLKWAGVGVGLAVVYPNVLFSLHYWRRVVDQVISRWLVP